MKLGAPTDRIEFTWLLIFVDIPFSDFLDERMGFRQVMHPIDVCEMLHRFFCFGTTQYPQISFSRGTRQRLGRLAISWHEEGCIEPLLISLWT